MQSRRNRRNNRHQPNANRNSSVRQQVNSNSPSQSGVNPKPEFTASIIMLSDWHIGTGAGRPGDIDSLVQRDSDGLPYIPAKTLTGIWRDACELVAYGLDTGDEDGTWHQWVTYLFGDQPALADQAEEQPPQPAALSIRAAHLPAKLRQAIASKSALKEAISFIKPGISIDPNSGCAEENFLRFEEMVRAGTILNVDCELNLESLEPDQQNAAFTLLVAGSIMVERLGGKRRRGAGKCELKVVDKPELYLQWLEKNFDQAPEPPQLAASEVDTLSWNVQTEARNSSWVTIGLRIKAESPLIIAKRTIGNITETLDYIPGSHLLRLIRRKLQHFKINLDGPIAHGDIVVTNGTVEISGQPGRPVPYALFADKLKGGLSKGCLVYNRFQESEASAQGQLKGERIGYIGKAEDALPTYSKVSTGVETHNTIKDDVQRPTEDVGGVYSYEAINPGTIFRAELRLPALLADQFSQQDKNWYRNLASKKRKERLGLSKKDDYGAISIEVDNPRDAHADVKLHGKTLMVWLLSDLQLRNERLRPDASVDALIAALKQHLGIDLKVRHAQGLLSMMARQSRLESWQVRWGLPRPSLVGLAAGSCFVFEVEGEPDPAQLAQLQVTGIGDRRSEGFGQICFNDPLLTRPTSSLTVKSIDAPVPDNHSSLLQTNDNERVVAYAQIIEQAAWRQAIRREALAKSISAVNRSSALGFGSELPTNTQLGALRSITNRLKSIQDAKLALNWLTHLEKIENRRDKWTSDSRQKVRQLLTDQNQIWKVLGFEDRAFIRSITLTHNGEQRLKQLLWAEAVKTLIDASMRAHKRDAENAEDAEG